MSRFSVTPHAQADDRCTLAVAGDLDVSTALRLEMALDAEIDAGARHLVIDLAETTFVDSTGLAAFMAAHRRVQARSGSVRLINASPTVMRVIELSALDAVLVPAEPADFSADASRTSDRRRAPR
jgi:anti-sigma B factor antagonist